MSRRGSWGAIPFLTVRKVVNRLNSKKGIRKLVSISFVLVILVVLSVLTVTLARAQVGQAQAGQSLDSKSTGWAFLAAAVSTGFGCLGAGIAVAYVGAAAVGAVGEKPEVAGRTLIFVGLAEGIAIYGLIIAIMILGKV
jgi:V/A-type H+-transporting ATPase subunit K